MKNSTNTPTPKTIDDYLFLLPENEQVALQNLREIIKSLIPTAEEVISYQIPTFKYYGALVGFAAFKNHCSLFVMNTDLLDAFKDELKGYNYAGSTIHFVPENPLPVALVEKIVKAKMKINEELEIVRKAKKQRKT